MWKMHFFPSHARVGWDPSKVGTTTTKVGVCKKMYSLGQERQIPKRKKK
jgi:hypothetical protein